jgi:hypothetical protein
LPCAAAVADRLVAGPAHTGSKLLSLDFLGECPRPWAANRSQCHVNVSPFGRSCIAVRSTNKNRYATSDYVVKTSSEFRPELVTKFMIGLLVLFMSGELAKSKTFQYASGASLGVTMGALLVVVVLFRRPAARRTVAIGAATLSYAGAVCAFLRVSST